EENLPQRRKDAKTQRRKEDKSRENKSSGDGLRSAALGLPLFLLSLRLCVFAGGSLLPASQGTTRARAWNSISLSACRSVTTWLVGLRSPAWAPLNVPVSTGTGLLSGVLSLTRRSLSSPRTAVMRNGLTPRTITLRSVSAPTRTCPRATSGGLMLRAESIS